MRTAPVEVKGRTGVGMGHKENGGVSWYHRGPGGPHMNPPSGREMATRAKFILHDDTNIV